MNFDMVISAWVSCCNAESGVALALLPRGWACCVMIKNLTPQQEITMYSMVQNVS
jgi:hypothetical protein